MKKAIIAIIIIVAALGPAIFVLFSHDSAPENTPAKKTEEPVEDTRPAAYITAPVRGVSIDELAAAMQALRAMVFTAGRTELEQGDILSLKLENVPDEIVPEIVTELGPAIFTKGLPQPPGQEEQQEQSAAASVNPVWAGFSNWYALIPVSNSRKPGDYTVTVQVGEENYETLVIVSEYEFDFQNMIIDTSVQGVADATSARAIEEFREKISPLIPLISEERYWDGLFTMPVDFGPYGFVSTEFGEIRITNGNQNTARSHLGMDLAVDRGSPVHATGAGKVLLSEFLLNTGNTVVIDHGGGLKSFYYHMDSVEELQGTIVERGTLIGTVGSTGYSTGPHLHFEMRIGEQPISPSMLLEPEAGGYNALASVPES